MGRVPSNQDPESGVHDDMLAPEPQPGADSDDVTPEDLALAGVESLAPSTIVNTLTSVNGVNGNSDYSVIARDGLNIRSGPGTEFPVLRSIPLGTRVHVLKREGTWALVDQVGDGAADGYVIFSYLQQAGSDVTRSVLTKPSFEQGIGDSKTLDVSTLQTIMNRCAGVSIRSKLDLELVVYALNKSMILANANTKQRKVAFLSQAVIETDYFRTFTEYGLGKGKSYAPYYGRGIHQLTWKDTYRSCSKAVFNDDRLLDNPDLIVKDIEINIKATAWYWRDHKPFNSLADKGDIDSIIHLLYGGTITSSNQNVRKSVILRRGYYNTVGAII